MSPHQRGPNKKIKNVYLNVASTIFYGMVVMPLLDWSQEFSAWELVDVGLKWISI